MGVVASFVVAHAPRRAVIHDRVRSTTQRRCSTTNPGLSLRLTMLRCSPDRCSEHQATRGSGIAAVGPDQTDAQAGRAQRSQQRHRAVPVLNPGGGDQHCQQQPDRVHGDVPFGAVHSLAPVVAAPFGADGLRPAQRLGVHDPAVGSGPRPSRTRTARRSRSCHTVSRPWSRQRRKNRYTAVQQGKSAGSARHLIPLSTTYRTASSISRWQ